MQLVSNITAVFIFILYFLQVDAYLFPIYTMSTSKKKVKILILRRGRQRDRDLEDLALDPPSAELQ